MTTLKRANASQEDNVRRADYVDEDGSRRAYVEVTISGGNVESWFASIARTNGSPGDAWEARYCDPAQQGVALDDIRAAFARYGFEIVGWP
jgi:hypothetical protein